MYYRIRLPLLIDKLCGIHSPVTYAVPRFCVIIDVLYCKRPIQCLASSKLLTPHPLTARRVCTPGGWEDTLARGRGGGGSIFWNTPDTALNSTYVSTVLFVIGCMRGEQAGQADGRSWCPGLQILLPEQTGGPRQAILYSYQLLLATLCSNI
jgi:hypothetical protein